MCLHDTVSILYCIPYLFNVECIGFMATSDEVRMVRVWILFPKTIVANLVSSFDGCNVIAIGYQQRCELISIFASGKRTLDEL